MSETRDKILMLCVKLPGVGKIYKFRLGKCLRTWRSRRRGEAKLLQLSALDIPQAQCLVTPPIARRLLKPLL